MKKSDECMGLFGSMRGRREPVMGLCALHSVRRAHLSFWKAVWTIDLVPSPRDAGRGLGRGARNLLSPGPLLHCVEEREKAKNEQEFRGAPILSWLLCRLALRAGLVYVPGSVAMPNY